MAGLLRSALELIVKFLRQLEKHSMDETRQEILIPKILNRNSLAKMQFNIRFLSG